MAVARLAVKQETAVSLVDPAPAPEISDPADPLGLEERILSLCRQNEKGITDDVIVRDQPAIGAEKRMRALQRLLSQGKVELLKQGHTLLYKLKVTSATQSKTRGFEKEQRLVYQIIEDAGNKGIWMRDIRTRSNVPQSELTRSLKGLESRKLIKSVRSVQAARRRLYMLYDLVPDESVTGGAWYSDQDFEGEFVDVLNSYCFKFLEQKAHRAESLFTDPLSRKSASYATSQETCNFITELGVSKVSLTPSNIETILNTLVFDGKAEVTVSSGGSVEGVSGDSVRGEVGEGVRKLYRLARPLLGSTALSRIPCGVCPVIAECSETSAISPSSCQYLREWLQF